jgi:thiamine biosynthesis lipoprotein
MGTRFEVALAAGAGDLRAAGEAALDEIEGWHRRLSRFAPDSLLSHIHRTAHLAPVGLDRDTFALFDDAVRVWRASAGAFDVTVAPAMARHGFPESAVPAAGRRIDGGAIELDASAWTIQLSAPDVGLDLGGIAKGHALDCAAAVLREHGVTAALLHGGTSTVVAIGRPEEADGWRVAIGPEADAPVVSLRDRALSVSDAASQRTAAAAGHIMDPRALPSKGRPVDRPGRAVVAGPSARLSDAWSTAILVLGEVPDSLATEYEGLWIPLRTVASGFSRKGA